ncbi:MAG: M16 family metallopeptidase [Hyphomicrobium sp.]
MRRSTPARVCRSLAGLVAELAVMLTLAALLVRPASAAEVQVVRSPGGIEAWLVENHSSPLIAARIVFRGGAVQDSVEKPGVAFFTDWMFNEGAGPYRTQELLQRLHVELGAEFSKATYAEAQEFSIRTLTANRGAVFDLVGLMFREPRFDDDAMLRARDEIGASIDAAAADSGSQALLSFNRALYGDHPFSRMLYGNRQSLASITADDLVAYRRRVFARDNLLVAVVGDIDATALGALLDRTFGALPATSERQPTPPTAPPTAGTRVLEYDVPQASITLGSLADLADVKERATADVINEILGSGGLTSRLMVELREKRGLVYSVSTGRGGTTLHDLFYGGAATSNENVAEVLRIMREEFTRLRTSGVTEDELARAKSVLKGTRMIGNRLSLAIAGKLVWNRFWGYAPDHFNRYDGYIDAVTPDDIRRVTAKYIDPENLSVVIVGKGVKL